MNPPHIAIATFVEADLFVSRPDQGYEVIFFNFRLSHTPSERFTLFWSMIGTALELGGNWAAASSFSC